MFIRLKSTPNSTKTAVQLVECIRMGKQVKQKIVRHFGYAMNEEEIKALKAIANQYKLMIEKQAKPLLFAKNNEIEEIHQAMAVQAQQSLLVDLVNIKEEKRLKVGLHKIIGGLFEQIGYDKVIARPSRRASAVRLLRNMVISRVEQPMSKRASVRWLAQEYGVNASLTSIYRMMDYLDAEAIDKIKQKTYQHYKTLFEDKINIVFYDCTTLYFESFVEDDLKQNGYSKDGKFNQAQVLLAMLVTEQGMPIGYELFEGSKFEGNTLDNALDLLYQQYKIDKLIFTADSALLSAENIQRFIAKNQSFIVGARLKTLPASLKKQILDTAKYKELYADKEHGESITYNTFDYKEAPLKLITTYSTRRAAKDQHDREKAIAALQKRLAKSSNPKSLLSNYGYKKFIQVEGEAKLVINPAKLNEAAQWDGLHGIITNINLKELSEKTLLAHYRGLWQIEETFRISKHNLRMRPIFHWTPDRIKAHIAICFMALACIRTLEYKVRLQYKKLSPAAIVQALAQLQVSVLKDVATNKKYTLPSPATQDAKKIYQIMGYKWHDTPQLLK